MGAAAGRAIVAVMLASACSYLLSNAPAEAQSQSAPVSAAAQMLAAMKLWGDIKLFDPQAAAKGFDWGAAFMNAEPALLRATNEASYRAAIASLLAPLHDPATSLSENTAAAQGRPSVGASGEVAVIAIPHAIDDAQIQADIQNVATAAAKSRYVLFDIRGLNESDARDSGYLNYVFSGDSPVAQLLSGSVTMPRDRGRTYQGYPNRGEGFEGYSSFDQISDAAVLRGTSKEPHRFGFLVDGSTSLPPLAIALASAGNATIYSTGGQPSLLSIGTIAVDLPYGVRVTYRTGDLADIAAHQEFASSIVRDVAGAAANLQSRVPHEAHYATPPPDQFEDQAYASALYPNEAMRMLGVARVYNVIRYFTPYLALMHDDWDAAARQAIDDELKAADARAYVLDLMRFYAHLHDSHGYVTNDTVAAGFGAGPPFLARYLHGQVVVVALRGAGASLQGLRAGDIVESVDGVPIRRAMIRVEAYLCSSTPQSADLHALSPGGRPSAFSGPRGSAMTLRFHHPGNAASLTATFTRGSPPAPAPPQPQRPKYLVLPGNVGYVDFDRLELTEVDAMFAALKNTRAIVFDNRGYPRGAAWPIAPRLTTATSLRLALFNTPLIVSPLGNTGEATMLPVYQDWYQMLGTAEGSRYLKPTVMLIDERAISQSEHSALFFRAAAHTLFVGTPTQGANGDVTSMVAPGNVQLYFSGEGVRYADGTQLQRVGVLPDVRIEPTAADIAAGNDVVLQTGLSQALRLAGASAGARQAAVRQEIARERKAEQPSAPSPP